MSGLSAVSYLLSRVPAYRRWSTFRYYGPQFKRDYYELQRHERYTPELIRQYQEKHFLEIFSHAYDNVPFYRGLYSKAGIERGDVRSLDDLAKLPCIEKDIVRANATQFRARNWEQYGPVRHKTSGSTGLPLEIYVDRTLETMTEAILWRHFNWAGYQFHHKTAYIEVPFGFGEGKIDQTRLFETDAAHMILKVNSGLLNPVTLPQICRRLEQFRPHTIHSYPNLLLLIAEYLRSRPGHGVRPQSIILRSEKLYDDQRQLIEEVFGCKAFEIYSQWEYICFAADCERHGLHHFFDLGVVNIMSGGKVCAPGEEGELVCTQLHNRCMPLINYRMRDYGRLRKSDCACGRQMPILEVTGCRGKDLVVTPNGYFNVMSGLAVKMQEVKPFKQVQFHQKDIRHMEVRLVRLGEIAPEELEALRRVVSDYFLGTLEIEIRFVDEIPRTAAQKYKYVISDVPLDFH